MPLSTALRRYHASVSSMKMRVSAVNACAVDASKNRSSNGTLSTHCLTGTFGKTRSVKCSLSPLVSCSGALFAVLAAAAALLGPGMLAFVVMLVASNILHAFGGPGADGVSFACHLGGFFAGTAAIVFARLRRAVAA